MKVVTNRGGKKKGKRPRNDGQGLSVCSWFIRFQKELCKYFIQL